MSGAIRVLIVDDSNIMREMFKSILSADSGIEVVAVAKDGFEGVKKAFDLKPEVIIMDFKMPVIPGFEAIEHIMEKNPIPIIMVSSVDVKVIGSALDIGAMDFVSTTQDIDNLSRELVEKIKIAAKVKPLLRMKLKQNQGKISEGQRLSNKVIAIGVSTGGPQALQVILSNLPSDLPVGVLVVQHMSAGFIAGLIEWLKASTHFDIKIAQEGDVLTSGKIFFAPDDRNLIIDSTYTINLKKEALVNALHIPSIDVMMASVAQSFGVNAIGVLLTGMGIDGVEGMRVIKEMGGVTIAQDEKSSVAYGMNKMTIERGFAGRVVPLEKVAEEIVSLL
jgi:two-component system, chemotaxis family, protein-glutamate methylesterase/glutaminase